MYRIHQIPVALLCLATLALAVGCASPRLVLPLESAEEERTAAQIPAAARAALEAEADGADIIAWEWEERAGESFYEAEWMTPEGEREATVTAEGAVVEYEAELTPEQAPASVRRAAQQRAGGAEVGYARRTFIIYEVEYTVDGREQEVVLTPTGRVLSLKSD